MAAINYQHLSVLVADDFGSFRNTVMGMLTNLGVTKVETASNGEDAIEKCAREFFDVVLCDYNLGAGRSGQHVLEELRFKKILTHRNLFILVSAEASRNIVMCAYDCEPDDYLMKPITARMLQQRMDRLLGRRQKFKPVFAAIEHDDMIQAMDLLIDYSVAEDRYSSYAQKILGEIFIKQGELDKAERLYTKALEARHLEWARLGLAKVKKLRGELDIAGDWLEKIVSDNPLYLPAYDVLAENWREKEELKKVQATVQNAVEVSPLSILRQKKLAEVARQNGDLTTALDAMRRTVKLGRLSCYGEPEDTFTFARTVASELEESRSVASSIVNDALQFLGDMRQTFPDDQAMDARRKITTSRVHAAEGEHQLARQNMSTMEEFLFVMDLGIDSEIDCVAALMSLGEQRQAESLLEELKFKYSGDENALQSLDKYLNEPVSEFNRERVARMNQEGIALYEKSLFDDALTYFYKVRNLFPKNIAVQLNIVQTLIGKIRAGHASEHERNACYASLELLSTLVAEGDPHYERYFRLRRMMLQLR